MARKITREEFDRVIEPLWLEVEYQNSLSRRTDDEAKDVPGFLTLLRRYIRLTEDDWVDKPGTYTSHGLQVEDALHGLRKMAAICVRSMLYCGVRYRE